MKPDRRSFCLNDSGAGLTRDTPACFRRKRESAGKPGSVVDSHSSGTAVARRLVQPTRRLRRAAYVTWTRLPIWPCSGWGLPAGAVTGPAVRSYRTISPLPDPGTLAGTTPRLREAPAEGSPSAHAVCLPSLGRLCRLAAPKSGPSAVCFCCTFRRLGALWPYSAQVLPGTLPCGARTFLCARKHSGCLADSQVTNIGLPATHRKGALGQRQSAGYLLAQWATADHVLEHQAQIVVRVGVAQRGLGLGQAVHAQVIERLIEGAHA